VCGAFLFTVCVKPVGLGDFLNNVDIEKGIGIGIGYEDPPNIAPEIKFTDSAGEETAIEEGDTVTVSIGEIVVIEVTNTGAYDSGSIEWYCQNAALTKEVYVNGVLLLVNTITGDFFNTPDTYPVSVTGITAEGVPYGVLFLIQVN
jgi:hypothetical protein